MEKSRTPGQMIAEDYFQNIRSLQEKEKEWWDAISKWTSGSEYVSSILKSLDLATEIQKLDPNERDSNEKALDEFLNSLDYVINAATSIDKNSMMIGKIISSAERNNSEIISIAQSAESRLKEFIKKEFSEKIRPEKQFKSKGVDSDILKDGSTPSTFSGEMNDTGILKSGARGARVKAVQSALKDLGFLKSLADGEFGQSTAKAVADFQKRYDIPLTGEVDEITYEAILLQGEERDMKVRQTGFWLLKMNSRKWEIEGLTIGGDAYYHTYDSTGQKREEYELFLKIKKGDKVIGFAFGEFNSVKCLFDVTEGIHFDSQYGEIISLRITRLFKKGNPLEELLSRIDFADKLTAESNLRLFSITSEFYSDIAGPVSYIEDKFQFLPFYKTEGNFKETEDQLEFSYDIESLATLISLEDVKPPLAIGLFGYWGSGKSFFMEKLSDKIDEFAGKKKEKYIKNVVQVKFNSWHYSDGNLWPSLITEIFDSLKAYSEENNKQDELDKLTETLRFTSMQKDLVEKRKKELEENLTELKDNQNRGRARLEDLSGIALLKLILSNRKIEESFSELKNKNTESIIKDVGKVNEYIKEVKNWNEQWNYYIREFTNLKGWRWIFVLGFAILVPLVVFLLRQYGLIEWKDLTLKISAIISLVTAILGNIIRSAGIVVKSFFEVLGKLDSMKKTVQSRNIMDSKEITEKKNILEELNRSLIELNLQIEDADKKLDNIASGRELMQFLELRARDEKYANQLGLISWIRKDFVRLDELLRKQHKVKEDERRKLIIQERFSLRLIGLSCM